MDSLNQNSNGEWLKLEIKSSINVDSCEDEAQEYDRILSGPIWNYGRTKDPDYYSQLLFGKVKIPLQTDESKILKGPEWLAPTPTVSFVVHLFNCLRKADPDATALLEIETRRSLTYRELITKAESLACGLEWLGLRPGQVIAIVSFHSIEAHLLVLAGLLIGAVPAILDTGLNSEGLAMQMQIASPRLVFSESGKTILKVETAIQTLMGMYPPKVVVNSQSHYSSHFAFHQIMKEVKPHFKPTFTCYNPTNPIFILFTSGTTGRCKGALISERYIMKSRVFLESVFLAPGAQCTSLLSAPFFWVSMVISFLLHLIGGNRLVFFRGPSSQTTLISALSKYKVVTWVVGPSPLMYLLHWPVKPRCPSLKFIITMGMAFPLNNLLQVRDKLFDGKVCISQCYGLTETGAVSGNLPQHNKYGSIGRPLYNVKFKFVERDSGLCLGPNEEGEICVKSDSLMLGYYNRPEATEEVFDDEGYFRTGDLGYYDNLGHIYITGRIKDLIKWKAYHVIPFDVEEVLNSFPEVIEAAVFGLYDEVDGELVTAAVVLQHSYAEMDTTIIEHKANAQLSHTQRIRGGVHVFTSLPKSSNSKPLKHKIIMEVMERMKNSKVENRTEN